MDNDRIEIDNAEQDHQWDLYSAELEGLAESALEGKSNLAVEKDLEKIRKDHGGSKKAVKADYERALSHLRNRSAEKSEDKIQKEFCPEAQARARQIENCRNKAAVFHQDFNRTGYIASSSLTLPAFLICALRLLNLRALAEQVKTFRGTQVGVTGPSSAGKSEYIDQLVSFVSYDQDATIVESLTSCSDNHLAYAGGEDGLSLQNKIIKWGELSLSPGTTYTTPMQQMWQTTTEGRYVRGTTISGPDGNFQTTKSCVEGPLHHIFSTVHAPGECDQQFSNRTLWVEIYPSAEVINSVVNMVLAGSAPTPDPSQVRLIKESWNCFFDSLRKVDPDDPSAFLTVDTSQTLPKTITGSNGKLAEGDTRRAGWLRILVITHTMLHQQHRQVIKRPDGRDVLVATADDVNAILPVFMSCVYHGWSKVLSASAAAFLDAIPAFLDESDGLTYQHLQNHLNKCERAVKGYVTDWAKAGVVKKQRINGQTIIKLGPSIISRITYAGPDEEIDRVEAIRAIAADFFAQPHGFTPRFLPSEDQTACTCTLCANCASECK